MLFFLASHQHDQRERVELPTQLRSSISASEWTQASTVTTLALSQTLLSSPSRQFLPQPRIAQPIFDENGQHRWSLYRLDQCTVRCGTVRQWLPGESGVKLRGRCRNPHGASRSLWNGETTDGERDIGICATTVNMFDTGTVSSPRDHILNTSFLLHVDCAKHSNTSKHLGQYRTARPTETAGKSVAR
jgi:hypothetical protein